MRSNVYRKLLNNTVIFAIGNIGSKGITLLLVPLYTFFFSQSEYGLVDIIQTTVNLLVPIVSLSIFEAVLRYVMDDEDNTLIFTNCFYVTIASSILIVIVTSILFLFNVFGEFAFYIAIILILQIFNSLYTQFIRGIEKIKEFAIAGLVMALTVGIMNLLFIVLLKFGIDGYFISVIIGLLASLTYINITVKPSKYLNFSSLNLVVIKKLLKYSIPLMPNSFMWWIINASSRYFILFFLGTTSNGLFAVASKIPSVLTIFNTIFFKAWQLSAIEEYNSKDNKSIYSNTFNYYQQFLFLILSLIILCLKPIFHLIISEEFYFAWKYVPFLLIGTLFSSFSSFLGTNYTASKQTKGVFKTSLIGGASNIILNAILIPISGIIGASLASMFSFLLITIIRGYDTKKYIEIEYNFKNITINLVLILSQIIILFLELNTIIEIVIQIMILILLSLNNHKLIKVLVNIFLKLIKKKKR